MRPSELRIYAEVLEQGLDMKKYLTKNAPMLPVKNVYSKKSREQIVASDSVIDRIRKVKDVDVLLTAVCEGEEIPVLMVEYSAAVPTDDHKMQRSDVYFWASIFKVPVLKICPANKGMEQDFGGGDKITDDYEKTLAFRAGAILHMIPWKNVEGKDLLDADALSCIKHSDALEALLKNLLEKLYGTVSHEAWYSALYGEYAEQNAELFRKFDAESFKNLFVASSRFKWEGQKLTVKINRFGHAMDPDRGILYFVNMLVGAENLIAEFQINRSENFDEKEGYRSLLDRAPRANELTQYIKGLIKDKRNVFSQEDALHILTRALDLPPALLQKSGSGYEIKDEALYRFFMEHPSMVTKSIFFLSTKLILTDKNRNTICSITWSKRPIEQYRRALLSAVYVPTPLQRLTLKEAKEDIVTYASALFYKKIDCDLLAVSYPGAQGDRCILNGVGRRVLRTYVDLIACRYSDNAITVFLEECKENIKQSSADVEKLHQILDDPRSFEALKKLCEKLADTDKIEHVYISVGAKASPVCDFLDVDYIFMVDIDNSLPDRTRLNFAIAFINMNAAEAFKTLMGRDGRVRGFIDIDPIYCIR